MIEDQSTAIDCWACLELMGHVMTYGRITEEEHFGQKLGRIEIPTGEDAFLTQWFGGSSVYRITPCTEEVARRAAGYRRPAISQFARAGEPPDFIPSDDDPSLDNDDRLGDAQF